MSLGRESSKEQPEINPFGFTHIHAVPRTGGLGSALLVSTSLEKPSRNTKNVGSWTQFLLIPPLPLCKAQLCPLGLPVIAGMSPGQAGIALEVLHFHTTRKKKQQAAHEQNRGCSHFQQELAVAVDSNSVQALQLGMLRRCCSILPCNNMKQKLSRKAVNQIRLIKQFLTNGVAHKNFIKTSSAKFISWVCHCYFFFFLFSSDNYYIRN